MVILHRKSVLGQARLGAVVRGLLVGGVALLALASSIAARGAELMPSLPRVSRPAGSNTFDWSGFYAGGQTGYAWGRSNFTAAPLDSRAPPFNGSLNFYQPPDGWVGTGSYFVGLQGGYNVMLPSRLVVGIEADALFPNLVAGAQDIRTVQPRHAIVGEGMLMSGTVRGRLGYAFGNWLPYATTGFAWTFDRAAWTRFDAADAVTAVE